MIVAPLGNGGVMTTTNASSSSIPPVSTHEVHEIERPKSVDGDGIDDARTRSNSFSTEHSDRSDRDVVFAAHHHHHHDQQPCGAVPYDAHSGERARGGMIQKFPARPSPALEALCASRARDAAPDGPELHACACAEMLVRERERFGDFILDVARAHHAPYRAQLVEWILDVCAGERFAPTTADVAIAFTDRVLSKTVVPKTSLHLVALCCLQIAVKYEEIEERVPTMSKLRAWTSNMYSPDIIQKMELAVLIELNWELAILTPAHFLESFLALTNGGTTEADEVEYGKWTPSHREELRQFVCQMYSLVVTDASFINELPSRVAVAVIGASRLNLGIRPMCPPALRVAADIEPQDVVQLVSRMLKLYADACKEDAMYDDAMEHDDVHGESLTIQVPMPMSNAAYERELKNASPTCPLDMHWDE